MSDEVKIFWAFLATCPVVALAITLLTILDGGTIEHGVEALGLWALLTALLAVIVLVAGGMYFVWDVGTVISAALLALAVLIGWALLAFVFWGTAEFDREILKPALLGAALITVAGAAMFGLLGLAMVLS